MVGWRCEECGFENGPGDRACQGCGFVKVGTLILSVQESVGNLSVRITTSIGKSLLHGLGNDACYYDNLQFTLDKASDGWFVIPAAGTINETLLNGRAISERTQLVEGDVLGVGRESKGITKLPLSVAFGD